MVGDPNVEKWYVYMIKCGKGTLYTGITTDVDRRFSEHENGGAKAARYLKGRGPLKLMFEFNAGGRDRALKLEHKIKRLPRARKERLIEHPESMHRIIDTLA